MTIIEQDRKAARRRPSRPGPRELRRRKRALDGELRFHSNYGAVPEAASGERPAAGDSEEVVVVGSTIEGQNRRRISIPEGTVRLPAGDHVRRATRSVAEPGRASTRQMSALTARSRTLEEVVLKHPARIKVHDPCRTGLLVELSGEFDVSCLVTFGQVLRRASSLGKRTFVDLSGVTFMDALCLR